MASLGLGGVSSRARNSANGEPRDSSVQFNEAPRPDTDSQSSRSGVAPVSSSKFDFVGRLGRITRHRWESDRDIKTDPEHQGPPWQILALLAYQSIGIVYGDIGTSSLYVIASTFTTQPSPEDVVGAVSLIIWSITAIVICKYTLVVLLADDNGQGGAFALYSLLKRQAELGRSSMSMDRSVKQYSFSLNRQLSAPILNTISLGRLSRNPQAVAQRNECRQNMIENQTLQNIIRVLVVAGVGFILGDAVLTPAVSVVSACEGAQFKWPSLSNGIIVGISLAILVVLFGIQRFGTGTIGYLFSPIITLWCDLRRRITPIQPRRVD